MPCHSPVIRCDKWRADRWRPPCLNSTRDGGVLGVVGALPEHRGASEEKRHQPNQAGPCTKAEGRGAEVCGVFIATDCRYEEEGRD